MNFTHLMPTDEDKDLLQKISGCRMMYHSSTNQKDMGKFKQVMEWFNKNLEVASFHVRANTSIRATYEFKGINMLANRGFVSDQHIHTDYQFQDAPGYEYKYK